MDNTHIRLLTPHHAEIVSAFVTDSPDALAPFQYMRDYFMDPANVVSSLELYRTSLNEGGQYARIVAGVFCGDQLIAVGGLGVCVKERFLEGAAYIHPEHRGKGIIGKLLHWAQEVQHSRYPGYCIVVSRTTPAATGALWKLGIRLEFFDTEYRRLVFPNGQ